MHGFLPGMRAALNYHSMFVHFPIALWLAALLFEFLAVRRASGDSLDLFHAIHGVPCAAIT